MPTTGASASGRAASSPVSSKHAMTCASALSAAPALICSSSPGTANASSYAPSIEAGPNADETARITVSGRAAFAAAAAMVLVIAAVVLGLTMFRRIGLTSFSSARDQHERCRKGYGAEYRIGAPKANHAGGTGDQQRPEHQPEEARHQHRSGRLGDAALGRKACDF